MPRGEDRKDEFASAAAHASTARAGAGAVADPDLAAGELVGEYRIDAKIGEGGFGTVFKATHPVIGSVAAIKVLKRKYSAEPSVVSRFVAEARAVNEIKHKNIINIFSFGELPDGRQYYVMEYLEGDPLDALLRRRGRFSFDDALPILRAVAGALDAAHASGVIHRDLKPANVLVAGDEVRLLDFGVAKLATSDTAHDTATGTPIGTPRYMSPEQARGRRVDHRADIFSFGVLVYEMLTGATPFAGDDFMEVVLKQIHDPIPPPSSRCDDVSAALDASVLQILAKNPAERPATATEALELVERGLAGAPSSAHRGRRLAPLLLGVGTLVAGGLALTMYTIGSDSSDAPPTAATAPTPAVTPAPVAAPPDASPPEPATVAVEIRDLQPDARVLDGDGNVLRVGPGVIELPHSAEPAELRFEADGYEPQTHSVRPVDATILVVELDKSRHKRRPPPKPKPKPDEPNKDDIVEKF